MNPTQPRQSREPMSLGFASSRWDPSCTGYAPATAVMSRAKDCLVRGTRICDGSSRWVRYSIQAAFIAQANHTLIPTVATGATLATSIAQVKPVWFLGRVHLVAVKYIAISCWGRRPSTSVRSIRVDLSFPLHSPGSVQCAKFYRALISPPTRGNLDPASVV